MASRDTAPPSLFAGSQDPLAPPAPPDVGPRCHCSPPVPSPVPGKLQARRQLSVACTVCCVFMVGEVIGNGGIGVGQGAAGPWGASSCVPAGGYLAHSLAIMTDAAHLLTDVGSMAVSLFSLWVSTRPPTKTMTFGWQRSGEPGGTAPPEPHGWAGC